ncbi:hypothetical protein PPERSA_00702 [Pseudocohnilembus persalinus]|uniref:Transmembrane protein n=1 Tax=Pseudocohnilembus persalinus TaxID=266149 RepID=A0A0V0QSS4_PSEPJ|nr:hypothetical protein PPERSA_00702 [Pseudocohnilembus persalinus]|eukprot:KRX05401.1 hypothetical protein PPERSA_00702 [Pseudocohnilembus persalinus]
MLKITKTLKSVTKQQSLNTQLKRNTIFNERNKYYFSRDNDKKNRDQDEQKYEGINLGKQNELNEEQKEKKETKLVLNFLISFGLFIGTSMYAANIKQKQIDQQKKDEKNEKQGTNQEEQNQIEENKEVPANEFQKLIDKYQSVRKVSQNNNQENNKN